MMDEWVKRRSDFDFVLCLDVSRWGRFQDIDLSAQYSAECKRHKKEVIYTSIGRPKENDPLYPVYVQFERFRAAQYSRELSDKVWRGCMKIAEQGYWAGGAPPYGLQRLLLDERREPAGVLERGQRKGIQNQRVTLLPGDGFEVAILRRIFHEFVEMRHSEHRIAERLNDERIPSPGGARWTAGMVIARLTNDKYAGTMVYNRTTQKLKTPRRPNPEEEWVRTPEAFEGVISPDQFLRAQELLIARRRKYQPEVMLGQLGELYQRHGLLQASLLRSLDDGPCAATFARRFGSLDLAFQQLYDEPRNRARETVQQQISEKVPDVLPYADFLVLERKMTISVQPAVPMPRGYGAYWPFRPDPRGVIDVTLGVLLSEPEQFEIIGYVALPRLMADSRPFRLFSCSSRAEMFGRRTLEFLPQLL